MTKRPEAMSVGDLKRRFSEILSRVSLRGERFVVERRGKPVAAVVSVEDLADLPEPQDHPGEGLLGAVGAWADFPDFPQVIEDIYRDRRNARDRPVPPLE